jgi:hypothetical protein
MRKCSYEFRNSIAQGRSSEAANKIGRGPTTSPIYPFSQCKTRPPPPYLFPTAEARARLFFSPRSTPPSLHLDSLNPASKPPGSKTQRTAPPPGLGASRTGREGVAASVRSSPSARTEVTRRGHVLASATRSSR